MLSDMHASMTTQTFKASKRQSGCSPLSVCVYVCALSNQRFIALNIPPTALSHSSGHLCLARHQTRWEEWAQATLDEDINPANTLFLRFFVAVPESAEEIIQGVLKYVNTRH